MESRTLLIRLVKSAYFRTPLWRFLLPVMKFDKNIAHLSFITDAIKSVKADGAVLEIGVGGGGTSIVINKFMAEESINFCASRGITPEIVHDNLGIVRKRGL
jgi:hypothetical protein